MKVKRKHVILIFLFGIVGINIPVLAAVGQWSSSGNNMYYNDGNVGIGTSTPGNNLDVKGSMSVYLSVSPYSNYNPGQNSVVSVGAVTNKIGLFVNGSHSGGKAADIFLGTTDANLTTLHAHSQVSGSDVIVKADGRLGVGTQDPQRKLHVKGNAGLMNLEGTDHTYIQWYPDGYNSGRKAWTGFSSATDNNFTIANNADIVLSTDGSVIVTSTLKAKEIRVKTNVWADYVFDENYELMPLQEVENFINENNHLPNIPSAEEVINSGISVGEMQQKQMEKIEELTLYVINLQKQIEVLISQN